MKVLKEKADPCRKRVRKIIIKKGYAWDGASGPTFDTCSSFQASLIHDAFYQCMRLGYITQDSRKEVDRLFLDMLRHHGMGPIRRRFWYWAVRLVGKKSATPKPHEKRSLSGAAIFIVGLTWLAHWLMPTQTADLLDCLRGAMCLGDDLDTKGQWWGCLIGNVLVLIGFSTAVGIVYECWCWAIGSSGGNAAPRKPNMGRKYPIIAVWIVGIMVLILGIAWLVDWVCASDCVCASDWVRVFYWVCATYWETLAVFARKVLALLGAATLIGLGYELLKGDSCATKE